MVHWQAREISFNSLYYGRIVCPQGSCTLFLTILSLKGSLILHLNVSNPLKWGKPVQCLATVVIPEKYQDLADVFDEKKADILPPHRPCSCPTDPKPGAEVPSGSIYTFSEPQLHMFWEYIQESLNKGLLCPLKSPAGAPIFFVLKKDGSLSPCVDYRALNGITICSCYPLPVMNKLFEQL